MLGITHANNIKMDSYDDAWYMKYNIAACLKISWILIERDEFSIHHGSI